MLLLAWAFGLVHSPWAILVLPICYLEGLLFSSISLFYTSLVPHVYSFNYFFSLFVTPMFYFSGVFFPLSSFPKIIQDLSWIAPLTPVVNLMRQSITGKFELNTLLLSLALVIGLTVIFFWLSLLTMRRRLTK
jgi:lipooligosaccharide transport system permease protein